MCSGSDASAPTVIGLQTSGALDEMRSAQMI
jgi:hypothetical protein